MNCRHRSRKRRPFSRYAARHRINSVYRDKSFSTGISGSLADASALEEKLEGLVDLKTQMRGLINDNDEIKHTQEEVNTTLVNMNHHITIMAENINRMRYMSHFRAIHRGSFFQEMRTTEVRALLPDAWGFVCPVHTPGMGFIFSKFVSQT